MRGRQGTGVVLVVEELSCHRESAPESIRLKADEASQGFPLLDPPGTASAKQDAILWSEDRFFATGKGICDFCDQFPPQEGSPGGMGEMQQPAQWCREAALLAQQELRGGSGSFTRQHPQVIEHIGDPGGPHRHDRRIEGSTAPQFDGQHREPENPVGFDRQHSACPGALQ